MSKQHWDGHKRAQRARRLSLARSRHLEVADVATPDRWRAAVARMTVIGPHDPPRPGRRGAQHQAKREARYAPLGTF